MSTDNLIQRLPRHLKMAELRAFAAVMEHGSFHKAAAVLHLTQPAVTKTIANLESTLGVKLFHRAAQGVEPTVHATSFAPRARAVFDELRRAAQDLALVSAGASGALRVGIVPMPAVPFLPVALQSLMKKSPDALFTVVEGRESELVDRLRKGDIEVAILRLSLLEPDEDMIARSLFQESLCVVAAKGHRLASRARLSWADLMAERWVLPPGDCYFHEHVMRTLGALNLPMPRHTVESASINIQFGMVLHAGLLSFGMRSQVEFVPGKEHLVRLPYELSARDGAVAAVSLKGRDLSPLAMQLIAKVRSLAHTTATTPEPAGATVA
jgi:LysR family transcriptional regulator, pca operon transcriptional activator